MRTAKQNEYGKTQQVNSLATISKEFQQQNWLTQPCIGKGYKLDQAFNTAAGRNEKIKFKSTKAKMGTR